MEENNNSTEIKKLYQNNLANIKEEVNLFGEVERKLSIKDRIGFIPTSIWEPNWNLTKTLKEQIGDKGQARKVIDGQTSTLVGAKVEVSIFNPHLAQMILSAYCPPNAHVFNPFSGDWCMGFVAASMGHKYTGIEIRQEEVDAIKNRQKELNIFFDIICADSQTWQCLPNTFDFCYTCPPYYDLEVYSNKKEDLSTAGTYNEFLCMLMKCVRNTYNVMKHNTLSCFVVGNFRNSSGDLEHFNGDLVQIAKNVGFKLHDELIWHGASNIANQRAGQFEANRKSVRVHEYILVFKKP